MNKKYASIDCGQKGGIAIWQGTELETVAPMPTNTDKTLNMIVVKKILETVDHVIIEEQFDPHGKNQRGMRTNIMNWGMIRGTALSLGKEVTDLNANEWVSALGLSNRGRSPMLPKLTKADRAKKANTLYNLAISSRDDGLADSVLIGYYQLKKWRLI